MEFRVWKSPLDVADHRQGLALVGIGFAGQSEDQ